MLFGGWIQLIFDPRKNSIFFKLLLSLLFSRNFAVAPSVALFSLAMHNDESPFSMAEVFTLLFCFLLPFFFRFDFFLCRFKLKFIFFFAILNVLRLFLTHFWRLLWFVQEGSPLIARYATSGSQHSALAEYVAVLTIEYWMYSLKNIWMKLHWVLWVQIADLD